MRLGALTAGIIGWVTLGFWLTDIIYTVSGHSLISNSPNLVMTIRNIIGSVIAAVVVATSHNIFHKMRVRKFYIMQDGKLTCLYTIMATN